MRITKFFALFSLLAGSAFANEGTVHEAVDAAAVNEAGSVQYDLGGGGQAPCCQNYCYDDGCGRRGSLVAGGQITFLSVYGSSLSVDLDQDGDFLQITPDFDEEVGYRTWVGYEGASGLGVRATYWDFDNDGAATVGPLTLVNSLNFWTLDLEATSRATFCNWDLLLSGGARIAQVDDNLAATIGAVGPDVQLNRAFDGAGLTFAVQGDHSIGHSGLGVYGISRGSLLFGNTDFNLLDGAGDTVATLRAEDVVAVWEIQVGVKYDRETQYGGLFVRSGVEAQVWELPPVFAGLGDRNIGLFGYTFAAGINY